MSRKYALIIGNTEYTDPGLAKLTAPSRNAEDFARVLADQEIGAFDSVKVLVNHSSSSVIEAIDEFFDQKKPDDMLVLYFSGHGIRDEIGSLYLTFKNTVRSLLRSTAIKSDYIREVMDQSRSKRQVLILDCTNSSKFSQGTKAELGGSMGIISAFQSYGRFVLTASDATQFAWEGDKVIGEINNSLFTHFLVKGLEGEADNDGDGRITVDELYDYAYDQVSRVTPKQTPTKSASKQEGEIVLRQSMRIENIKPVPIPEEIIDEIKDTRPYIREAAVHKLGNLLRGKNLGLARSAIEALEKIATEDDSRRVSQVATQVLKSIRQIEQKAEEERLMHEKAWAERRALKEAESLSMAQPKQEAVQKKIQQEAKEKVDKPESKKRKNLKISVTNPKLLSKRFSSSFLLQIYLPDERSQVTRNIKSEFVDQKTSEYIQLSSIRIGQRLKVKFFSPVIDFPDPVIKLIDRSLNKVILLGMPKDNCETGSHKISVSISDADKGQELESFTIIVQVVDFAFDHISRPLLSRVGAVILGIGSFAMFILTFLEQIDKTVGLTSGAAAGVLALGIYASFYNLYQRVRPNTP